MANISNVFVRHLSSSSAAAFGAPVVAAKPASGGLLAALGFGAARIDTPLSEALPSVPKPVGTSVPAAAPKLQTSVLASGTKLAAIDTPSPLATIALVAEAGSVTETDATTGASKVLQAMAFKATANRSTFRMTRELEKIGATTVASAGRETTSFAISSVKMHTPEMVEVLVDSVLNAKYNYWEVAEALEVVKAQLADASADPAAVLTDVLHRAAFDGPLGQPTLVAPSALDGFTNATLKEYVAAALNPASIVLAGAGVGHEQFKTLANPLFAASAVPASKAAASTYAGGALNVIGSSPLAHVALAFEAQGGLSDAKAAAAAYVVKALLDGSRSVLPHAEKESVSAFAHLYSQTGIFGLTASGAPNQSTQLVDTVAKKVEALAKGVSDAQLQQAKQVVIGGYKTSLASSSGLVAAVAPQVLRTGKFDASELVASVDALSAADVSAFLSKALKAAPTVAAYGSLGRVPRFDSIAKRFA